MKYSTCEEECQNCRNDYSGAVEVECENKSLAEILAKLMLSESVYVSATEHDPAHLLACGNSAMQLVRVVFPELYEHWLQEKGEAHEKRN